MSIAILAVVMAISGVLVPAASAVAAATYTEVAGIAVHTWSNYTNAGGTEGPLIARYASVQVSCRREGFRVADGNTWWYRIASSPWNGNFYGSADAFYNNGQTSGSLAGTPFYDPAVPICGSEPPPPPPPPPPTTYTEVAGVAVHTWSNYANAGGTEGPLIARYASVQVSCRLEGFRVADGNTWWYRIASSPWNGNYYGSADAFYNNGQTSGSLLGTPFYDPAVPLCSGQGSGSGTQPQPKTSPPAPSLPASTTASAPASPRTTTPQQSPPQPSQSSSATAKVGDPCIKAFGAGAVSQRSIFGGKQTDYSRQASLFQICEGWGISGSAGYSLGMKCTMLAAAAVLAGGNGLPIRNACIGIDISEAALKNDIGSFVAGVGCGLIADVFGTAAGIGVAGMLSATGPAAVVVGVATYRVIRAALEIACGGIFDGGGKTFGYNLEATHERNVALDIWNKGKCLRMKTTFGYIQWLAVAC